MLKAKEAMLNEESKFDGTKNYTDATVLINLTKKHLSAQRDFAIIDKIYKQAFKAFEKSDVEQASAEEIKKAMENFRPAQTEQSELDNLLGGSYHSGDESYNSRMSRIKKSHLHKTTDHLNDLHKKSVGVATFNE
jgi:hypothetical protein